LPDEKVTKSTSQRPMERERGVDGKGKNKERKMMGEIKQKRENRK
jgi:hypothetical protein